MRVFFSSASFFSFFLLAVAVPPRRDNSLRSTLGFRSTAQTRAFSFDRGESYQTKEPSNWSTWKATYYQQSFWNKFDMEIAAAKKNRSSAVYCNQKFAVAIKDCGNRSCSMEGGLATEEALTKVLGGQSHEELLKIMSGVDKILAEGSTPDWRKFLPHHEAYFGALKERMHYLYFRDDCAPFFNTETQRWTTCWYERAHHQRASYPVSISPLEILSVLSLKGTNAGFCGSNIGMELPVPCRMPQRGHDYGVLGTPVQARLERPNQANSEEWECNTLQFQNIRPKVRKLSASSASHSNESNLKNLTTGSRIDFEIISVPQSATKSDEPTSPALAEVTVSSDLVIRIEKPTRLSENLCGDNPVLSACFLACCDSLYRNSPFCLRHGMDCY